VRLLKVVARKEHLQPTRLRQPHAEHARTKPIAAESGMVIFLLLGGSSRLAPPKSSVVSTRPAGNT
jgi:hypothetical protein